MKACGSRLAAAVLLAVAATGAWADVADEVRRKVTPSVVFIHNEGGFGSGVAVTPSLVLTNFHVANDPLPLNVTARVRSGGRLLTRTFKNVQVVSIHPTYDLAVIRVTGAQLIPAELSTDVSTGERAFAIGNPTDEKGNPRRDHMTSGLISAAERIIDGQACIQTNVGIEPGNSGGALCNAKGQVVGIVTWRFGEQSRLGFAVPVRIYKLGGFGKLEDRKVNAAEAERLLALARRAHRYPGTGTAKPDELVIAQVLYHQALSENPRDPRIYLGLGLVHLDGGAEEAAAHCFGKAVELAPTMSAALAQLGFCELRRKNVSAALAYFRRGVSDTTDKAGAALAAEGLAEVMARRKDWSRAAYACHWARRLYNDPVRDRVRKQQYEQWAPRVAKEHYRLIQPKTDPGQFSLREFDSLRPVRTAVPADAPPDAAAVVAALLKDAPSLDDGPLKVPLAKNLDRAVLAYFGCHLVLYHHGPLRMEVLDLAGGRYVGTIPVDEKDTPIQFAAGGRRLLVYKPKPPTFKLYDLGTLKKIDELPNRLPGPLTSLAMGLYRDDRALVTYRREGEVYLGMMGLKTFNLLPSPAPVAVVGRILPGGTDANLTCTLLHESVYRIRPGGFSALRLRPDSIRRDLLISPDGRRFYGRDGIVTDAWMTVQRGYRSSSVIPVYGSDFFVQARGGVAILRDPVTFEEVSRIENVSRSSSWGTRRSPGYRWQAGRIWASAPVGRLAVVSPASSRILIYPLHVPAAPAAAAPPRACPGRRWTYRLALPPGATATLVTAPPGMTLDEKTGALTWPVPRAEPVGTTEVLANVAGAGSDDYQRVFITVDR